MLAQSFMSAEQLGITEPQLSALQKTLVLLETGKLTYVEDDGKWGDYDSSPQFSGRFNMAPWGSSHPCGTICCIGGTAELVGKTSFALWSMSGNDPLIDLFAPNQDAIGVMWDKITVPQASTALRSFLTTGDAKWSEAVR